MFDAKKKKGETTNCHLSGTSEEDRGRSKENIQVQKKPQIISLKKIIIK